MKVIRYGTASIYQNRAWLMIACAIAGALLMPYSLEVLPKARRKGLEYAIVTHMMADLLLYGIIGPLVS